MRIRVSKHEYRGAAAKPALQFLLLPAGHHEHHVGSSQKFSIDRP
jgi:hypothetical protein